MTDEDLERLTDRFFGDIEAILKRHNDQRGTELVMVSKALPVRLQKAWRGCRPKSSLPSTGRSPKVTRPKNVNMSLWRCISRRGGRALPTSRAMRLNGIRAVPRPTASAAGPTIGSICANI